MPTRRPGTQTVHGSARVVIRRTAPSAVARHGGLLWSPAWRSPDGCRAGDIPALVILASFVALTVVGAAALALPVAADQDHPGVLGALFLATLAVTVTG